MVVVTKVVWWKNGKGGGETTNGKGGGEMTMVESGGQRKCSRSDECSSGT